nr:hypothetical protein [Latilactobacillus fuchuensis]
MLTKLKVAIPLILATIIGFSVQSAFAADTTSWDKPLPRSGLAFPALKKTQH